MDTELKLYTAVVTDINDKDKQGKIQIRLLPEFQGVKENLLPWAVPFVSNNSEKVTSNDLPEKGSIVRVLVDKAFKRFFYLGNMYFYKMFDYSKVDTKLQTVNNIDKTYENISFTLYKDESLSFHNNNDGSHGYIHKNGSYFVFDKNGNILFSSQDTINIKSQNDIEIMSNIGRLKIGNSNITLTEILTELIDDLPALTTEGSPTTHTSPKLTAQMITLKAKLNTVLK